MPRVDQFMGNIFSRGGAPGEIEKMKYHQLSYWSSWHDLFVKAEKKAAEG